jgi:hypothetical protein
MAIKARTVCMEHLKGFAAVVTPLIAAVACSSGGSSGGGGGATPLPDFTPVGCSATARHCMQGVTATSPTSCLNNAYTAPEPVLLGFQECMPVVGPVTDALQLQYCNSQLCSSHCIAPSCIDCVATVVPAVGSQFGCGGSPVAGGSPGPSTPPPTPTPVTTFAYSVRGYLITDAGLSTTMDYEFPFDASAGVPADIGAIEDLFYGGQTASSPVVGGLKFARTQAPAQTTPSADFLSPLTTNGLRTLNAVILPGGAGAPSSFDGFIGSHYETSWITFTKGAPGTSRKALLTFPVRSWSSSPFLAVSSAIEAALVGSAPGGQGWLADVDYSQTASSNGGVLATAGLSGEPVDVAFGEDVWVAVKAATPPHSLQRFAAPALHQTQQAALDDEPVAVAGAKLAAGANGIGCSGGVPFSSPFVVVATKTVGGTSGGGGKLLAFPEGNLAGTPTVQTIPGTPVAMLVAAMTGIEYAWVATTEPNMLYQYSVSAVAISLVAFASLDTATPLRLTFSGTSGAVPPASGLPGCDDTTENLSPAQGTATAELHVLLKNL